MIAKVWLRNKISDLLRNPVFDLLHFFILRMISTLMKIPLCDEIFTHKQISLINKFTPQELLGSGLNIGLIIDLTCTDRYYDKVLFERMGIQHQKLGCVGHDIPSHQIFKKFIRLVEDFLIANSNNGKLIGVHCTHGVNRTGYLICRYMIQRQGMDRQKAIAEFNNSRGNNIDRQNYLDNLQKSSW